ncbi:HEAT repeat domain-containing protein [Sphingomonas parva]|uniref:HEAT repeat domain-containing protein n=1 Tax=Sphingomonas parva TaxID=2555898 RepID=UPI0014300B8E|nr:HEAT repeat domain-containing protein [Sphingomonas parva]
MTGSGDPLLDWLFARPGQDRPGPAGDCFTDEAEWLAAGRSLPDTGGRLASLLREHPDPVTRSAAALALGLLGETDARRELIEALSDAPLVAMEAAAALAAVGDREAVEPLCAALRSASANVRANAVAALGRIGGRRAEDCIEMVIADPDPMVRAAAADARGRSPNR